MPCSSNRDVQKPRWMTLGEAIPTGHRIRHCTTRHDRSSCRPSMHDVVVHAVRGGLLLVIFVVYIFLQSWRQRPSSR